MTKADLPTSEKVNEPDPDRQRRKKELAGGRHEENPRGANEAKQFECRGWRSNVKREERHGGQDDILQVGKTPLVLLQVSQAVPEVERVLQARDVLAAMRRVGLCSGAPANVAGGEAVEESQVDVLRQQRRQLGLSRSKIHHCCWMLPKKDMFKKELEAA